MTTIDAQPQTIPAVTSAVPQNPPPAVSPAPAAPPPVIPKPDPIKTRTHPGMIILYAALCFATAVVSFRIVTRSVPSPQWVPFQREFITINGGTFSPETAIVKLAESDEVTPLEYLVIDSHYPLSHIPDNIDSLRNLKFLLISNVSIRTLPESIGNLSNLTGLYVYNTPISSLPQSIGRLSHLRNLVVSGGRLTSVPPSIGNLTELANLNLSYNRLTEFPPAITHLDKLIHMDFTGNPIRTLPKQFPPNIGLIFVGKTHIPYKQLDAAGTIAHWPVYY